MSSKTGSANTTSNAAHIPRSPIIDLENRNPHGLPVASLQLDYSHVFAEPDASLHSFDFVWELSYQVFTLIKLWTYRILSLVFGVPLAVIFGLVFGISSCFSIWCCVPAIRCVLLPCKSLRMAFEACASTCIAPIVQSMSLIFSSVRIRQETDVLPMTMPQKTSSAEHTEITTMSANNAKIITNEKETNAQFMKSIPNAAYDMPSKVGGMENVDLSE